MLKAIMAILMATGLLISVTGCETMAGAGRDIQRGGEAIEDKGEGK